MWPYNQKIYTSWKKVGKNGYCELRPQNAVSLLKRHYCMIKRLLTRKGVKVTFLHCPLYSLEIYNRGRGHPNPCSFKSDDKILTENVNSVNRFIDIVNKQTGTYSPRLNEDSVEAESPRKGRKDILGTLNCSSTEFIRNQSWPDRGWSRFLEK